MDRLHRNVVGVNPYRKDTAIFVTWDDWGGWYDDVAQPNIDHPYELGYVSKAVHEFGRSFHLMETTHWLGSIASNDVRADDLMDCFNFSIAAKVPDDRGVGRRR